MPIIFHTSKLPHLVNTKLRTEHIRRPVAFDSRAPSLIKSRIWNTCAVYISSSQLLISFESRGAGLIVPDDLCLMQLSIENWWNKHKYKIPNGKYRNQLSWSINWPRPWSDCPSSLQKLFLHLSTIISIISICSEQSSYWWERSLGRATSDGELN